MGKHALEEPRTGQGDRKPPTLTRQPSHPEIKSWEGGRKDRPSQLRERRHNYSEAPSGAHQKSKNKITDTSFHQAPHAQTAGAAARPLERHHAAEPPQLLPRTLPETRGRRPLWLPSVKGDVKKALILTSLPATGFENPLFSLPKYVWQSVSLYIFPSFFLYNWGLCEVRQRRNRLLFNLKDK